MLTLKIRQMLRKNALAREHQTIEKMISLYCHTHHQASGDQLCYECGPLALYAHQRLDRCLFGSDKTTCAKCPVHCYQPNYREQILQVMRYSGPRMLLQHPVLAILHLVNGLRKPPS